MPTLPVNIKNSLVDIEGSENEHPLDKETFNADLTTVISMRANTHQTPAEYTCSAHTHKKQHRDYNRLHQVPNKIKVDQKVFLKN